MKFRFQKVAAAPNPASGVASMPVPTVQMSCRAEGHRAGGDLVADGDCVSGSVPSVADTIGSQDSRADYHPHAAGRPGGVPLWAVAV